MRLLRGFPLAASLVAAAALTAPAAAQDPDPAAAAAPTAPAAPGATAGARGVPALDGELPLSLSDALAMGLENNLDVEIVRHDPPIARYEHRSSWGAYDPRLFGDFQYASDETPIASELQTNRILVERTVEGAAGVRGLLPKLGWQYELAYAGQSLETTSSIQSLSPEYRANLIATATFPILRGFLWGEAWTQVSLTGVSGEAALEEFRRQLIEIVRGIEDAYWNLSAREQDYRVARKSLQTANELQEQTNAQYEVGVVSRVEVVEAEAGVADREFNVVTTENRYRNAQDTLIDLILGPNLTPGTDLEIVPSDSPEDYRVFDVDPEGAVRKAFEHRPELALARYATDQREIQLKFAKNQRLPQLDLRGSWGLQGLAGQTNSAPGFGGQPRQPIDISRSYWATDDDFFHGDQANSWSAGALLSIPFPNTTGRADVRIAELELRKSQVQLRREEQQIILEVREAIRNLRSATEGIQAAEKGRAAAQEQLRAERIRLEHGESTPFDVLLREEDLVEAESQRINALQAYHLSITGLDRAQGTILRDRNIVVDDALPLR